MDDAEATKQLQTLKNRNLIIKFLTVVHLQLQCPVIIATIFVSGIGGTFQYGFCVSVMNAPSAVSS